MAATAEFPGGSTSRPQYSTPSGSGGPEKQAVPAQDGPPALEACRQLAGLLRAEVHQDATSLASLSCLRLADVFDIQAFRERQTPAELGGRSKGGSDSSGGGDSKSRGSGQRETGRPRGDNNKSYLWNRARIICDRIRSPKEGMVFLSRCGADAAALASSVATLMARKFLNCESKQDQQFMRVFKPTIKNFARDEVSGTAEEAVHLVKCSPAKVGLIAIYSMAKVGFNSLEQVLAAARLDLVNPDAIADCKWHRPAFPELEDYAGVDASRALASLMCTLCDE